MNTVSERTRNKNVLVAKTKAYKDNIKETEHRMRSTSSLNNLAGKLYSDKGNVTFTPKKVHLESTISKNASTGKFLPDISMTNPQKIMHSTMNIALSGLSTRASHVSSFADMNTSLLKQKKDLETRIAALKEGIAQEKKKLHSTQEKCKKNQNHIENFMGLYKEAHTKSLKLNENIDQTNQDCQNHHREIKGLRRKIEETKDEQNREKRNIDQLQNETKNLKVNLLQEQKMRGNTKMELGKAQRSMKKASIHLKEFEGEKDMLLLEINQSVNTYKL